MTMDQFMENFQIKHLSTVRNWMAQGLLPGATYNPKTNAYFIPDLAWPPYTATRAKGKNANALRQSMVKACIRRRYIMAKLYKISQKEFLIYIQQLESAGVITVVLDNNIPYYYSTAISQKFVESRNPEKLLAILMEATAKGTVGAIWERLV